jgi:hypothetical protein
MPKYHSRGPEKRRSSTLSRIRRLMRRLLWKNNHIDPPRRKSIQKNIIQLPEVRRRRRKKSFLSSLFGGKQKWQDRLIGLSKKKTSDQEPLLIAERQEILNKTLLRKADRRRKGSDKSFLKRLFSRKRKPHHKQFDISDALNIKGPDIQSLPSHYRKRRKRSVFKRLFSRKEKPPPKLVLPSDKTKLPVEKEKIIYRDYLPYFVNSIMMFMLAYIVAWLTYQMAVIITASFFRIDSVLYFFEVMFPVGNASSLWSSFNIIIITISGPITSVAAGTLYYYFIVLRKKVKGNRLMFFNWLIFHSFSMFFAAFVAGVITRQGFGYVINYMFLPVFFRILFSLIFLFILSWIGFRNTRHILETSNSITRVKTKNRRFFLISQTLLPWFVGSLLLIAIKIPGFAPQHEHILIYDLIIIASVLFMIIPPLFNKKAQPDSTKFKESRKQSKINKSNVLLTIIVLVLFRAGLSFGLHFVIQFVINISVFR